MHQILDKVTIHTHCTKMFVHTVQKFSIKDFYSGCYKIRRKLSIRTHLLEKSLIENFILCSVTDIRSSEL